MLEPARMHHRLLPVRIPAVEEIDGVMKTNRRGLLIVISASLIAGFLILEDVVNQREVDEFNRAQLREQFGGHIHYHGTWTSDMACLFALAIVAIEGRALVIAVRRVRAGRKSP